MFNSGEGGSENGENSKLPEKNNVVDISEYRQEKNNDVEAPRPQEFASPESEPGIANPELADYRVELPESATFNDFLELMEIEFGDVVAGKVEAEIQYQIQTRQSEGFSLDMKILDFYEEVGEAEYWLPVILG